MSTRPRRSRSVGLWFVLSLGLGLAGTVVAAAPSQAQSVSPSTCRWSAAPVGANEAAALASSVVGAMTVQEKVAFLGLQPVPKRRIEQENPGVPRLCIGSLILRDGPVGVASGSTGVTALPSELNLAATFSPTLAQQYGSTLGREAHAQGTMGIQGPGLNVSVYDNWGRGFENLGEDPTLTSVLGASLVTGIQGTGEFAMAKHLGVYAQETARSYLDMNVSQRAQEEVYLAPFRAAAQAGVASVMCATGQVDGVGNCADAASVHELGQWGFSGFVRTDAGASTDEVASLISGVDLFRPFDPAPVEAALADGSLPGSVLDRAVGDVLAVMFRYGDVTKPVSPNAGRIVTGPASVATSTAVAEQSMVLLKNDGVLPFRAGRVGSVAVIGAAAQNNPIVSGGGSSQVTDTAPTTDLSGIKSIDLPQAVSYTPAASLAGMVKLAAGPTSEDPSLVGYQQATLALPPSMSGLVDFSYASTNPTQLVVDGAAILDNVVTSSGAPITFEKALQLAPGSHLVRVEWPDGTAAPAVTAQPVDGLIAQAVTAAQSAATAVVVVGERDSEGADRATLALPGYQDQLIQAVAAANPRTVVVVHSGGPVLMPWLSSVAAVLEAWYPGESGGAALSAVLSGAVDPSGRLPVAFPTSDATAPMIPASAWPNAATTPDLVALGDLGVGSEWYAAHGVAPRFAFGFGLSYTTFSIGAISARAKGSTIEVRVPLANTGKLSGRDVALANVTFPAGSGEPPGQLKALGDVTIAPHRTAVLALEIPIASLFVWQAGSWELIHGTYSISVGSRNAAIAL